MYKLKIKTLLNSRVIYLVICLFIALLPSGLLAETLPGSELIKTQFSLINQDGKPVTEKDYLGKYQIIFFGFTHCPNICPTALLKITSILKLLGADRNKINPLFISIDPKRDTPERLKTYLANFDSKLVGLTGTQENIDQASQIFRAYYNEIALKGDYTFDHSSVIYFMDPKGNYANYFSSNMTEQEIVNLIKKEISG